MSSPTQVSTSRYSSEYFPSAYLDSLFAAHPDRVISINADSAFPDVAWQIYQSKAKFFPVVRKRIEVDTLAAPPWNSCHLTPDSSVVVASNSGHVGLYDLRTERTVRTYTPGAGPGEFRHARDISVDDVHFAVSDLGHQRIQVFGLDGRYRSSIPFFSMGGNGFELFGEHLLATDFSDGHQTILHTFDMDQPTASSDTLRPWFELPVLRSRNELQVRSDGAFIAVLSRSVPYILVFDRELNLHRVVQFRLPRTEHYFQRIHEKALPDQPPPLTLFFLDVKLVDAVLYVNTLHSGLIFRIDLNEPDKNGSWKVLYALRKTVIPIERYRAEGGSNLPPPPITVSFGVQGNRMVVCDNNPDHLFFDIFEFEFQ